MTRQRLLKLGAVLVVATAFLVANYFNPFAGQGIQKNEKPIPRVQQGMPSPKSGVDAQQAVTKITVTPETKVHYQVQYAGCGHIEPLQQPPQQDLIGLSEDAIKSVLNGWSIDNFSKEEVTLTLPADGLCSKCAEKLYIGVKDGYVVIYQGIPGTGTFVKRKTEISVQSLPESERSKLQSGIPVKNEEEALSILEGLASLTEY